MFYSRSCVQLPAFQQITEKFVTKKKVNIKITVVIGGVHYKNKLPGRNSELEKNKSFLQQRQQQHLRCTTFFCYISLSTTVLHEFRAIIVLSVFALVRLIWYVRRHYESRFFLPYSREALLLVQYGSSSISSPLY